MKAGENECLGVCGRKYTERDGEKKILQEDRRKFVSEEEKDSWKSVFGRESAECNKRRSYSVRGRGEEKVEFEKKLPEKKKVKESKETHQFAADISQRDTTLLFLSFPFSSLSGFSKHSLSP